MAAIEGVWVTQRRARRSRLSPLFLPISDPNRSVSVKLVFVDAMNAKTRTDKDTTMTKTTKTSTTTAKFYAARAKKIAAARARNAKLGLSVRAQREVARLERKLAGL